MPFGTGSGVFLHGEQRAVQAAAFDADAEGQAADAADGIRPGEGGGEARGADDVLLAVDRLDQEEMAATRQLLQNRPILLPVGSDIRGKGDIGAPAAGIIAPLFGQIRRGRRERKHGRRRRQEG